MILSDEWRLALADELVKKYFTELQRYLRQARKASVIYPPEADVFKAFNLTPPHKVKAVILGQDPYHTEDTANGLAFSTAKGRGCPPSLVNILTELKSDVGVKDVTDGDLSAWAREGVLLMNATLTVERSRPNSHKGLGWERFTDMVIAYLNKQSWPIVFMLWGNDAIAKADLVSNPRHLVLKSTHPSPFSAARATAKSIAFLGSRPFSQTNQFLKAKGQGTIDWSLKS
jgi:uracil-DNA glycosylase